MSERAQIENRLVEFLESRNFNAPYGILRGMEPMQRGGKIRTVSFGIARNLDCCIWIWSPNRITVDASGPSSRNLMREYKSLEALIEDLSKCSGTKPSVGSRVRVSFHPFMNNETRKLIKDAEGTIRTIDNGNAYVKWDSRTRLANEWSLEQLTVIEGSNDAKKSSN